MSANQVTVDVDRLLDDASFGRMSLIVAICTSLILVLDGFDIQVIALAAPAIAVEFGIDRSALGPTLAAALIGIAAGGFVVGPTGDRWGRRNALLASVVLFGAATLLAMTSPSIEALTGWRFVTGIGLGGALPNATALLAEYVAPRWRSQAITAAIVGVPLGGLLGALFGATVIQDSGWRTLFAIGGALPLAAAALMYFLLPESPRFLVMRPDRRPELTLLLNRMTASMQCTGSEIFVLAAATGRISKTTGVRRLFEPDLMRDTLAVWLVFATNLLAVYAFFSWTPVVLTSLGYDLPTAIRGLLVFNLAGMFGALANAWIIRRLGSRAPLAVMAAIGILALAWLSWVSRRAGEAADLEAALPGLMIGIGVAGLAIIATQVGMYAVLAHVYPTACRSSGVGWSVGMGRIGAVASSFAGGLFLARGGGRTFFGGVAAVLVITLLGVLLVRRHLESARGPR